MSHYKTGQHGNFFWIEFPGTVFSLSHLLKNHSGILEDKYLAIVCFDSGPLNLVEEEKDQGWYEKDKTAYSPLLSANLIANLPGEQHDQWCLFTTPTEFPGMTDFVNYGGFTLVEKSIEFNEQLTDQFWQEITKLDPINFIADGDNFIFVSKKINEINLLKNSR